MRDQATASLISRVSCRAGAAAALSEIAAGIDADETAFILIFVSPVYDMDEVAASIAVEWPAIPVHGCSTAGEIHSGGYGEGCIVAVPFPRAHFAATAIRYALGGEVSLADLADRTSRGSLDGADPRLPNRFGLLMIDGLSGQEEIVTAGVAAGLDPSVPVFGGSAGDGLDYLRTHIIVDGEVHENAAVLILASTSYAFQGIVFDHFRPTDTRLVVTEARPDDRIVLELNGAPAAAEYARILGKPRDHVTNTDFAENPLLVRSGQQYHVRSIRKFTPDGGILMMGAIDDGLVLRLGTGKEVVHTIATQLAAVTRHDRRPDIILAFDCVLRRLEIEQKNLGDAVSDLFHRFNVIGFSTYGEQHGGVHVNQTFVGVAMFASDDAHVGRPG